MLSFLYLLIIALPIIITFIFGPQSHKKTNTCSSSHCLPPGPPCLPLIGNLLQIDGSNPHISLTQLSRVYGPLMSLKLGWVQVLVASSAKMAEEVLKTHDLVLCSRPSRVGQQKLSYNGIDLAFSPFDAYWKEMRKTCIVHLFNSNRVQDLAPVRAEEVSKVMEKVSKSSIESKPFDLSEAMISLAGTIVCRMAFGKGSYNREVVEEGCKFQVLINEAQEMFTSFFFSNHFPFLGFIDKLTGLNHRLDRIFMKLDAFCQQVVDEHRDPNRVKLEKDNVIDVLVRAMNDGSFKFELTVDHVKAIVMNLFIAGTDTAAAALVWTMTYLMKNPIAMKKVQEEVRGVVGMSKGFVDEQDIKQLPYLKAVVKETMRLQPPAPLLLRESTQDCVLGGYKVPPKTVVHVNVYAIGRDPEIWGEDSEEFKPERFIENSATNMKGYDFDMVPFGGGRRMCPGMHMGLAIVNLTLANLLYGFDWEMPVGMEREDLDMEVILGLTMHKKNPLCLMATKHV